MDGVQGKEPAAGLVNTLRNKVCGLTKLRRIHTGQPLLRIRHCAGIKPYIYKVALSAHWRAALGEKHNLIYIRPVKVYLIIILLAVVIGIKACGSQRILLHNAGCNSPLNLCVELPCRTYANLFRAILCSPNRKRSAPEAASGEIPILKVLQPLAKAAAAGALRPPGNCFVKLYKPLLHCSSPYEPRIQRIVEHRLVCSPAMRIGVHVLLYLKGLSLLLKVHTYIYVYSWSIGSKGGVISILNISACIGAITLQIYAGAHKLLREILYLVHLAGAVHHSLLNLILVHNHKWRHSVGL